MIIATSGHVDHGKTLLVHALTGIATDKLEEEKARGLTIDLGFAYIHKQEVSIGFIDVPGHIKFISNMLAGVSSIDYGMLVIAADDGPMPQTREHLAILNILGIKRACIVITKIDRVDAARLAIVKQDIQKLIQETSFASARIFEVSSISGDGITELKQALWNEANTVQAQPTTGHFRLAIDRCFTVKGTGLVVSGSVFSGKVSVGDEIFILPNQRPLRVRGIHRQNELSKSGQRGDRCAINISGDIDRYDISRGNWLSSSKQLPFSNRIDISMNLLQSESKPLKHWTPVHIHAAAQHVTGRIATLEGKAIQPNQEMLVQLVLSEPINVCYGDRIVIRDQSASRTLGGGTVLDPFSPLRGRTKALRLKLLKAMQETDLSQRIDAMLEDKSSTLKVDELLANFNLQDFDPKHFGSIDVDIDDNGTLYARAHLMQAKELILNSLEKWHKNFPNGENPSEKQLSNLTQLPKKLANFALQQLSAEQKIKIIAKKILLLTHQQKINGADLKVWQSIEPLLKKDPLRPPVLHELAKAINLSAVATEKLLKRCIPFGLVVRPVKNRFFLPDAITQLKQIAMAVANEQADEKFTVVNFRDKSGLGRNLSIEILEYFDQIGFTRRQQDHRIIQDASR